MTTLPDETLDEILANYDPLTPSVFIHDLRSQLSARHKLAKAAASGGVKLSAIKDLRTKTYYALGAVWQAGRWSVHPDGWELEGMAHAAGALSQLVTWAEVDLVVSADTVDSQLNAAYVAMSRGGHATFQVADNITKPTVFADLYVFATPAQAGVFRDGQLVGRPQTPSKVQGLVRR